MKRIHLLLALCFAAVTAHAKTPVETYGRLWASGGYLCDSTKNNHVILRGMSLYWSSEPDGYAFFNGGVVRWLQSDWKVSVIRAPMAVNPVPSGGNKSIGYLQDSATNMSRIQAVVNSAIAQGLYVIVDWHVVDVQNSGSASKEPYTTKAVAFFKTMATKYKNAPNVLWEVWNE